jgi:hypothetical protein
MSEDSILLLLMTLMFLVCVILLYWIYAKYDNHANIDIDFKDYCQWKKETKYYKPLKEKENEVQENKIK